MVPVNYFTIFLAAVAAMFIGFLWYGPLFGAMWTELMGWSKSDIEKMKKEKGAEINKMYTMQFVGSLAMAFVLAHALVFAKAYLGSSGVSAGLQTGFWNWFGFIAPVTMGSVFWEGKSMKLWALNNSNHLVTLLVMGVILSLWG